MQQKKTDLLSLKNKAPNHPIYLLVSVYTDIKQNITFFIHREQNFSMKMAADYSTSLTSFGLRFGDFCRSA